MPVSAGRCRRCCILAVLAALLPLADARASGDAAATGKPVVYAALTSRGVVKAYYDTDTSPTRPIFSFGLNPGTQGAMAFDAHGNLFVTDPFSTWVFEYAPGAATPSRKFPTTGTPYGLALLGDTLYVFQTAPSGGNASVAIYENGSTSPTRLLTAPQIEFAQGIAVDAAGNVFVGWGGARISQFGIGVFAGGQMPMRRLPLSPGLYPVALAVDAAGNLLVDSPSLVAGQSIITVFPPGQSTPSATIGGLPSLLQVSFTADGSSFYTADTSDHGFSKFAYPSGTPIYTHTDSDAFAGFAGIACWPPPAVGTW